FDALCNAVLVIGPNGEPINGSTADGTTSSPCGGPGLRMRSASDGNWYIESGALTNLWWSIPPQGPPQFWLRFDGTLTASRIFYYEGGLLKQKKETDLTAQPGAGTGADCEYKVCETGSSFAPLDADKAYLVTTPCTWVKVLNKWYCL